MPKEHPAHILRISNSRRRPAGRLFAPVLRKGECGEAVENERGICYTFLIAESRKPDAKPVDYGGERYADHHRKAQKEISETGSLSVAARQQLWLALGPAEVNEQYPGPLTEAVRKRAQLALACGKKVSRVWSAYDAEDKRPQALLRKISAYLEGKCTAEELDQLLSKTDFMSLIGEERYSNAPLAALAAWSGQ